MKDKGQEDRKTWKKRNRKDRIIRFKCGHPETQKGVTDGRRHIWRANVDNFPKLKTYMNTDRETIPIKEEQKEMHNYTY